MTPEEYFETRVIERLDIIFVFIFQGCLLFDVNLTIN